MPLLSSCFQQSLLNFLPWSLTVPLLLILVNTSEKWKFPDAVKGKQEFLSINCSTFKSVLAFFILFVTCNGLFHPLKSLSDGWWAPLAREVSCLSFYATYQAMFHTEHFSVRAFMREDDEKNRLEHHLSSCFSQFRPYHALSVVHHLY